MHQYSFDKHRLLQSIDEAYLNKGIRCIFLKGNALTDRFLWNLRSGSYPLVDTLCRYAEHRDFLWFINVDKQGQLAFWKRVNGKLMISSYPDFVQKRHNKLASLMSVSKRQPNEVTAEKEALASLEEQREEVVHFDAIVDALLKEVDRGSVLLHIEDFDWFAGFYSEEREHGKVRKLQLLENCQKHLVVASFRDLSILQDVFRFEVEGQHVISVGDPSKEEIQVALTRVFWQEIHHVPRSFEIDILAASMSVAGYSLKQCIAVLKIVLNTKREKLQLSDFHFTKAVEEEIYWEDIHLNQYLKAKIWSTVNAFLTGSESTRKGILFTGPPGTGKTMIAKALANEANMHFVSPTLSELKGEYVGQSAPKIKKIFEDARAHESSIIFLDEVDTLFPARGGTHGDSYTVDMVNEFLTQLDGATTGKQRIFVVAATNRVQLLDSAVRSRLGDPIEIGLPGKEEREALFKMHLPKLSVHFWERLSHENKQMLEIRSTDMSGRDIKNFCIDLSSNVKDSEWLESDTDVDVFFKVHFGEQFNHSRNWLIGELERMGVQFKRPMDLQNNNLYSFDDVFVRAQPYFQEIMEDFTKKTLRQQKFKLLPKRGILLYGPPGNGKTAIASELAYHNDFYLVKVESKDIVSTSERDVLDRLDSIFRHVIRLSRVCDDRSGVVLFFDEIDALAGPQMTSSVRGTLLGLLADPSGIRNPHTKVVLMAATNFKEVLDEAAIRKGRFDEHILIEDPDEKAAIHIVQGILNNDQRNVSNRTSEKVLNQLYDHYITLKREQIKQSFELQYRELSLYKPELFEEKLREKQEKCRLSGAELRDLAEDLIRLGFEHCDLNSLSSELVVNDQLVLQMLSS
jgi:transitional endoplasmic reticulum ATPase